MDTLLALDRALATVETISSIRPIPDADAIVCARIRGWDVVVRAGEFEVGQKVIYIEVDSLLPTADPRFAFLAPRGVRTDEQGNTGHVLKTARLRGQYSQGIAFDLRDFPEVDGAAVGDDVTARLGIVKWDPPLPQEIAGLARGYLPTWVQSTSEARVQNFSQLLEAGAGLPGWVATEKVDGASMTVWQTADGHGVATRSVDLVENEDNKHWAMAKKLRLHETLRRHFGDQHAVVQGELYGPGVVAKNSLQVPDLRFAVFTLQFDGRELPRSEWPEEFLANAVPVYKDLVFPATVDEAVAQVESLKSLIAPARAAEGVVWRNVHQATIEVNGQVVRASAKVISNRYLMKADR